MLRFPVSAEKSEDLRKRMALLKLSESDFEERFFCPSHGRMRKRGAQIGVHLRHPETGQEVRCQKSSSQSLNRFFARRLLVGALEKCQGRRVNEPELNSKVVPSENAEQHMHRMFMRSFERDVAQPYPMSSQKLLGVGNLPAKLIGILGEREMPAGHRGERRSS